MKFTTLLLSLLFIGCSSVKTVHLEKDQKKSPTEDKKTETTKVEKTKTEEKKSADAPKTVTPKKKVKEVTDLSKYCFDEMKKLPGKVHNAEVLKQACQRVKKFDSCNSLWGSPIFHYQKDSIKPKREKRILTISLIHGDEKASGSMARSWISRLEEIDSRNTWRVIPIANPDGSKLNTRMNANKVDLNRNFPTEDWQNSAIKYWKQKKGGDPRRYPGPKSTSEIETQCLVKHIEDFKPDFIISIHTPYGVLDFDGPKKINFPQFKPLPWISLGNYPGSLGRYMWVDNNVPVLTIELKGNKGIRSLLQFDRLQDITGTVAIQSDKVIKKKKKNSGI